MHLLLIRLFAHILAFSNCTELRRPVPTFRTHPILYAGSLTFRRCCLQVAAEHSECPSGARSGGSLGRIKPGQMVPEFDEVPAPPDLC